MALDGQIAQTFVRFPLIFNLFMIIIYALVGIFFLFILRVERFSANNLKLIGGIFLLYDPIKTLSKLHIVMQRSVQATVEIFRILDSESTVQDKPDAIALSHSAGARRVSLFQIERVLLGLLIRSERGAVCARM